MAASTILRLSTTAQMMISAIKPAMQSIRVPYFSLLYLLNSVPASLSGRGRADNASLLRVVHVVDDLVAFFRQALFHPGAVGGAILGGGQLLLIGSLELLGVLQDDGASFRGMTMTPSGSARMMSPGLTLTPPQAMGTLISPGPSL